MAGLAHAFGEPGRGIHSFRVLGLAAVDLLATAGVAAVVAQFILGGRRRTLCNGMMAFLCAFIILIAIAVTAHELIGVNTQLNAWLFGRAWPHPQTVD
jgi:hypothetical protein